MACLIEEADAATDWPREDPHPARRLAGKLNACCQWPSIKADGDSGTLIYCPNRCNCRICPLCSRLRAAELQRRVADAIGRMDSPRMLTLTLAHASVPLADQITRIHACFRELRRRKAWKEHVRGGIAVLEITWNNRSQMWHVHIHILIDATYWRQAAIADHWLQVTGDSRIVDIRLCRSKAAAAQYVAKYVAKGIDLAHCPDRRIAEHALALSGVRIAQTFGSLHGTRLKAESTPRPKGVRDVIALDRLWSARADGDARAARLWRAIHLAVRERDPDPRRHKRLTQKIRDWLDPPPPRPRPVLATLPLPWDDAA